MDYWDYLAHGWFGNNRKGSAKKDHKYYQRVEVGTDRNGNTEYYYFYSKEAYDAWKNSRKVVRNEDSEKKPTRAQQKDWDKQKQLNGKARLTGAYRREKHPNGRSAWVATEEYEDKDGKLKLRKKYISGEQMTDLRNNMYKKKRAEAETGEEKKARMKAAKKRYKKKMSAVRRKRAVQKGAQKVARLLGGKLTFQGK